MKPLPRILAPLALVALAGGAADAQNVRALGHTVSDDQGGLTIQWPASGFEARFEGGYFQARIEDYGDNWLKVEVDGKAIRIDLQEGIHDYQLFSGEAGSHTIKVTRRTGSLTGPTRFISIKAHELTRTEEPARRIMVIGDSIASGFGVEGKDQTCPYSYDTHNADVAYPSILARNFGADLQSVSVDGHGLIRNYSGESDTLRTIAWRTLQGDETPWPAASWKPQVVVVNLGTSDFSAGDPGEEFDMAYVTMLRKIRYAWPEAEIYGAIGGQLYGAASNAAKSSILGAVETIREAGDQKAHFIEFTPPATGHRYGCSWHPGTDAQTFIAGQLQAAITADLGWKPVAAPSPASPPDIPGAYSGPATLRPPLPVSSR